MKRLIYIIAFIFSIGAFAQGGPKVDVIKFRGEVTTAVRNGFDVPTGETWLIFNVTSGLLEFAGDDDVWESVGDGIQEGANDISGAGISLNQGATNTIQVLPDLNGNPSIRIIGGNGDDAVYQVMSDDKIDWNFTTNSRNYQLNASGPTIGTDLTDKAYVDAQIAAVPGDGTGTDDQNASEVTADVTNFDGLLSATDDTVQKALETLDEVVTSGSDNSLSETNQTIATGVTRRVDLTDATSAFNIEDNIGSVFRVFQNTIFFDVLAKSPEVPVSNQDVTNKLYVDNAVASSADSGQSLSPVTKSSGTSETYDNSDITEGGTANAKRRWNKHTTNDTIVLSSAITRYNQPWLESLNGADSLYIKKDTGTTLYIADSVAAVSGDGVILKGGRKAATIIAESANTFFVSGEVSVFNEGSSDPIDTMDGIIASWRADDLPAVGQPAGNWTDRINSFVMVAKGSPTIQSSTTGKEVFYDGVDDAHANDADDPEIDFIPETDAFTYVFKIGSPSAFGEQLFGKRNSAASTNQYGAEARGADFRVRLGGASYNFTHNNDETIENIYVVAVSTTQVSLYANGTLIGTQTLAGSATYPPVLAFGATENGGTANFTSFGMMDFLLFDKTLNQTEVNTIQSNL